jgi:carbon dioxide concentrating mechanism protein CcmO
MVVLDAMEKTAGVRVLQTELNDRPGVCLKLLGSLADVQAAAAAAEATASAMQVAVIAHVIPSPSPAGNSAIEAAADFNPLFEQATVQYPEKNMSNQSQAPFAVGLIETQGFTAVFEAIDTAQKTAAVEVLAPENHGGGYITVLIKGDVAAVQAAIDAGRAKVEGLGKLIAAHVIASPSAGVLALLPK